MGNDILQKAEAVFESFNMTIEGTYDRFFKNNKSEKLLDEFLKGTLDRSRTPIGVLEINLKKWQETPMKEIDGLTPEEFFNGIQDLNELLDIFKLGARVTHDHFPESLLQRIRAFGDIAVDELAGLCFDKQLIKSDDDSFYIPVTAIKLLGKWKVERLIGPLIDLALDLDENDEAVADSISVALEEIGLASVEPIIQALDKMSDIGTPGEFLMGTLMSIGLNNKSDRIYRTLKNSFARMADKSLGAEYLGDYGDGRAVPALRGYVEKNLDSIDYQAFYSIKRAIEKLGGNMDDIKKLFQREEMN